MRIRTHAFALGALLVAALPFAGCDDSSDPSDGTICFQPRIEKSDACGLRFSMLVAPACAAADGFYSASLQVRHDFDNDGTWDTGYLPLEEVPIFDPITLPVDVWVVRSEVLYAGGSTEIIESSLDLPDWAPTPPDIIAAFGGYTDQPIDTVRVGVPWTFTSRAVTWMNGVPGSAIVRYYVDDVVVDEGYVGFDHPLDPGCVFRSITQPAFTEPGTHQLKVVWDVGNLFAETDETNNEIVKTLIVVP